MAKQNNPQMSTRKDTVTQITDVNGNIVLEIGQHEYSIRLSDGSRTHRQINETIQTVDGTIWGPLSKFTVGICTQCRQSSFFQRKTHGIVAMHKAKTCVDGGELCCPSHYRLGKDQKYRCLKHHSRHLLKDLFYPVFFKREDG